MIIRIIVASTLLLSTACQPSPTPLFTDQAMSIPYRITVGHPLTQHQELQVNRLITTVFEKVDAVYNQWNPDSEISQLNGLKAREKRTVSPELYDLLLRVDQLVQLSEGRYDPTIEPLKGLWIDALEAGVSPSTSELAEVRPSIGWDKIHLAEGQFWKDHDGVALNLDSISKGHAVDMLASALKEAGFTNVLVDWGGEIKALGQHPTGRPWHISIRGFESRDPGRALGELDLHDEAVATSGDYLQQWRTDEGLYTHILDPRTLTPLKVRAGGIASVTVIAPNCALADALATTAMLFETTEACKRWIETVQAIYPETAFWIATRGDDRSPQRH